MTETETSADGSGRLAEAAVTVVAIAFVAALLSGALGTLAPDTVAAVADPFLCDGELERSSIAGVARPGREVITSDLQCAADDGTTEGMTARVYLVAGLVYAAVLTAIVVAAKALGRVRDRRPVAEHHHIDRSLGRVCGS